LQPAAAATSGMEWGLGMGTGNWSPENGAWGLGIADWGIGIGIDGLEGAEGE